MQVCFTNLGCKLNQAELESLARDFCHAGFEITRDLSSADLHVVNTCTVTQAAARDSRKLARRGRRLNPEIRTVLTGCYVAEDAGRAQAATGADLVVGNQDKGRLLDHVLQAFPGISCATTRAVEPLGDDLPYAEVGFGNSRALVKIEDGCNMRCSFCIIPMTRGRQISRPAEEVIREVRGLVDAGFREVVLTGVQISSYRRRGTGLFELTERLLDETRARRLRLTSIAPWQFDQRLLGLFESGRLCRHFHLSLQSGCNSVLERMRRPYTADAFANLTDRIRERVPGVAITTDVIAGFPGETDREFEQSLAFVRAMAFARLHVFPYSARPGTEAVRLANPVAPATVKARVAKLLAVAAEGERAFLDEHLGSTAEVLWETRRAGAWRGTSDNYLRVRTRSAADLSRRLSRCRLETRRGNVAEATLEGDSGAEHAA